VILVCTSDGKEIDRITVTGRTVTYDTLAAQSTVEAKIDELGHTPAMKLFRAGWSNGYILIQPASETP
jgi:hypothetical protein